MKVFHSLALYQDWRRSTGTAQIGFVPTMGALHIAMNPCCNAVSLWRN